MQKQVEGFINNLNQEISERVAIKQPEDGRPFAIAGHGATLGFFILT